MTVRSVCKSQRCHQHSLLTQIRSWAKYSQLNVQYPHVVRLTVWMSDAIVIILHYSILGLFHSTFKDVYIHTVEIFGVRRRGIVFACQHPVLT